MNINVEKVRKYAPPSVLGAAMAAGAWWVIFGDMIVPIGYVVAVYALTLPIALVWWTSTYTFAPERLSMFVLGIMAPVFGSMFLAVVLIGAPIYLTLLLLSDMWKWANESFSKFRHWFAQKLD